MSMRISKNRRMANPSYNANTDADGADDDNDDDDDDDAYSANDDAYESLRSSVGHTALLAAGTVLPPASSFHRMLKTM